MSENLRAVKLVSLLDTEEACKRCDPGQKARILAEEICVLLLGDNVPSRIQAMGTCNGPVKGSWWRGANCGLEVCLKAYDEGLNKIAEVTYQNEALRQPEA